MREISLLLFIVLSFSVNAQIPDVAIAEDYTNPKTFMWKSTNEYRTGKIENGVYVSKAKKENASLGFSVDLMDMQKGLKDASDMEFELIKLSGETTSSISVNLTAMEGKTAYYLKFKYNGTGNWSFENGETKQQFGAGKVAVKEGNNLVKIKHRERSLKIYVNNEFVYEHTFEYSVDISWWPIYIAGSDKDVVLGLDKAVFKGYSYSTMLLEEMAQKAEKEKLEIESKFIAKGSFPEGKKNYTGTTIPVSFDYNANWKLEDFVNQSWLGATGVELTVSKSEEGGYFLVTTDTTSLSYDGYYKKYVDVNYFTNGIKNNVSDNIIDAEPIINGQKAKMREAFNNDPEINPTGTIELWCLIIKDKRYYMLYAVTFSADRASVLSSFNSFKIN